MQIPTSSDPCQFTPAARRKLAPSSSGRRDGLDVAPVAQSGRSRSPRNLDGVARQRRERRERVVSSCRHPAKEPDLARSWTSACDDAERSSGCRSVPQSVHCGRRWSGQMPIADDWRSQWPRLAGRSPLSILRVFAHIT